MTDPPFTSFILNELCSNSHSQEGTISSTDNKFSANFNLIGFNDSVTLAIEYKSQNTNL